MNAPVRHARSGFTLIEMMITLGVFLLLAAAIFGIFGATLEGAGTLEDNQNRTDQVTALGAWLNQSLLGIPATGRFVSYHRDGRPFHVSGVIWGEGNDLHALDLQPQANGEYTLRFTSYVPPADSATSSFVSSVSGTQIAGLTGTAQYSPQLRGFQTQIYNDAASLTWRPLVRDLASADWRFRRLNIVDWEDTAAGVRPALVELTFQPAGTAAAIVDDFWIPPLQPVANPASPVPAAAVTANP